MVIPTPTLSAQYGTPVSLEMVMCADRDDDPESAQMATAGSFTVRPLGPDGITIPLPEITLTIDQLEKTIEILKRLDVVGALSLPSARRLVKEVVRDLRVILPRPIGWSELVVEGLIVNLESQWIGGFGVFTACDRRATIATLRELWALLRYFDFALSHLEKIKKECKGMEGLAPLVCELNHLSGVFVDALAMINVLRVGTANLALSMTVGELTVIAEGTHVGIELTEDAGHETVARSMKFAGLWQAQVGVLLEKLSGIAGWEIVYLKSVIPPKTYLGESLETAGKMFESFDAYQKCLWKVAAPRYQGVMTGPRLALPQIETGEENSLGPGDDLPGSSPEPEYVTERMNFLAETAAIERVVEINFTAGTIDIVDAQGRAVLDDEGEPLADSLVTDLALEPATWDDPSTTHTIQLCQQARVARDPYSLRTSSTLRPANTEIQTRDTAYWLASGDLINDPPSFGSWSTSDDNAIGLGYFATVAPVGAEIRTQFVCDDADLDDDGIVDDEAGWNNSSCVRPLGPGEPETPWQTRKLERSWIQMLQFGEMGGVTAAPVPEGSSDHSCGLMGIPAIGKPAHIDAAGNLIPSTIGVEVAQTHAWLGMLGPYTNTEGELVKLEDYEVADRAQQILIRLVTELGEPDPTCWQWNPMSRRYEKKLECSLPGGRAEW